jgi:hypothetical protein
MMGITGAGVELMGGRVARSTPTTLEVRRPIANGFWGVADAEASDKETIAESTALIGALKLTGFAEKMAVGDNESTPVCDEEVRSCAGSPPKGGGEQVRSTAVYESDGSIGNDKDGADDRGAATSSAPALLRSGGAWLSSPPGAGGSLKVEKLSLGTRLMTNH